MAVLKSNMIFIFKCWGVQRKPSSFPEVYLKLRDEKNREIICIYSIDDVIDKEKNLKDFIHDVVFDIASDYISCDESKQPNNETQNILLNNDIRKALKHLDNRERTILINRYGLFGESRKTLEEIGQILGFSKERIRQIENQAIKKLREDKDIGHLKEYIA